MKKQKPITTYASDLEIIIQAAKLFSEVSSKIMPSEQAMNAFSAYHKIYAPMLRNYQEVKGVKEILENFENKLRENYHGFL